MIKNPVAFIGQTVLGGTTGSIPFIGPDTEWAQDNAVLFWDYVNDRFAVGSQTTSFTLDGSTINCKSSFQTNDEPITQLIAAYADGVGPTVYFAKSRGTPVAKTIVPNGDLLGSFGAFGYNGTDFSQAAGISFLVDGTPGAADMPGSIVFATTPDGSTTPTTALTLKNDQLAQFAGRLAVGTNTQFTISGVTYNSRVAVTNNNIDTLNTSLATYSDTLHANLRGFRSRGTSASRTTVQSSDFTSSWVGYGYDGTDFEANAGIFMYVDGTPGSNDMPGGILFATTPDGSATLATAMTIFNSKAVRTESHLEVTGQTRTGGTGTATAQLDVLIGSSSRIGEIIKAASSQTADFLELQDSSANVMTKFDSQGYLTIGATSKSVAVPQTAINLYDATTITVTSGVAAPSAVLMGGTFVFQSDQTAFANGGILYHTTTYKNHTSLTGNIGNVMVPFYNAPTYTADTNATTVAGTLGRGFTDGPIFSRVNGGTLTATEWNSFFSQPTSNTGVTITDVRGVWLKGMSGGTITTQTMLEIEDVPTGTTKISMRVKGTAGHNRIVPKTKFGADSAPNVDVDITGAVAVGKTTVSLTANNQAVATANISYISLSSDNGTAANRIFALNQSTFAGQRLILEWTGTNAGRLVDDAAQGGGGNQRLGGGNWNPTQYDTIELISNGTDWVELSRSAN